MDECIRQMEELEELECPVYVCENMLNSSEQRES